MDYQLLYSLLPKPHWEWSIEDTRQWLTFIGLPVLHTKFQICSIDGSILSELSEQDLKKQLQITSRIMVKKLMNWIKTGFPEFDKFVESQVQMKYTYKRSDIVLPNALLKNKESFKEEKEKEIKSKPREPSLTEQPKKYEANELIITQLDNKQVGNFYLKQKGGIIGRHAQNQIIIIDEFVSRQHAEIIYEQEQYFIRDLGSSSGTFIKIAEKLELQNGMVIEMGSNQFQTILDKAGNLTMKVVDGPNEHTVYQLIGLENYSVGRKQSNHMNFPDDQHLSGIHSKLFKIKGEWFIEDIATTNGTWLRLSRQAQQSQPYLLEDKSQFKLSANLIYECQLNINNRKTFKTNEQKCMLCKQAQKNSIIMPCKHAIGCYDCLINQQYCPICQSRVSEVIKMFTA